MSRRLLDYKHSLAVLSNRRDFRGTDLEMPMGMLYGGIDDTARLVDQCLLRENPDFEWDRAMTVMQLSYDKKDPRAANRALRALNFFLPTATRSFR